MFHFGSFSFHYYSASMFLTSLVTGFKLVSSIISFPNGHLLCSFNHLSIHDLQ